MSYCPSVLHSRGALNDCVEAEVKGSDDGEHENRKVDVINGEEEFNRLARRFSLLSDHSLHIRNANSRDDPDLEKGQTIVGEHPQHCLEKVLAEARGKERLIGDKNIRIRKSSPHFKAFGIYTFYCIVSNINNSQRYASRTSQRLFQHAITRLVDSHSFLTFDIFRPISRSGSRGW